MIDWGDNDEKSPSFYKLSEDKADNIEEVKDFNPIIDPSSNSGKFKLEVNLLYDISY